MQAKKNSATQIFAAQKPAARRLAVLSVKEEAPWLAARDWAAKVRDSNVAEQDSTEYENRDCKCGRGCDYGCGCDYDRDSNLAHGCDCDHCASKRSIDTDYQYMA